MAAHGNSDAAVALRRDLHRNPELSGAEAGTAERVRGFFAPLRPDGVIADLGGHGTAFVFAGEEPGPTVMLRCELDALAIPEAGSRSHRSLADGCSHACGHDGHMAILAAVGQGLAVARPRRGRVVLLYQPSEEDGRGARAVINDPRFEAVRPDLAFALHNLPGFPRGALVVREGTFCCASRGVEISLEGVPAHASQPETGTSPARAMCRIIELLESLGSPSATKGEVAFATVVGARLGDEPSFGTAPGRASILGTLRSEHDVGLERMVAGLEASVREVAAAYALQCTMSFRDDFAATVNAPRAVDIVRRAAGDHRLVTAERPFRWSEDFGRFTAVAEGALFGIGAGEGAPDLHNPGYDFPDELVPAGAEIFRAIIDECLG